MEESKISENSINAPLLHEDDTSDYLSSSDDISSIKIGRNLDDSDSLKHSEIVRRHEIQGDKQSSESRNSSVQSRSAYRKRESSHRKSNQVPLDFPKMERLVASPHHSVSRNIHARGILNRSQRSESPDSEDDIVSRKISLQHDGYTIMVSDTPAKAAYESYDYDEHHSLVQRMKIRNRTGSSKRNEIITKWVLTFIIAASVAVIAVALRTSSYWISKGKFQISQVFLDQGKVLLSFSIFMFFNAGLVLIGSLCVAYIEPMAKGSGIPEIKCTLNGLKLPRIVRIKTLFVKIIGVITAVSAGMPIGAEGPMIHAGAVCGAGISQGKSTSFALSSSFKYFKPFRNDREKRDFISCGAAAGVACAFGAPIGGVLFALEEGSSFWNLGLTWRAFFCAMCSSFLWNIIWLQINHDSDNLGASDMFIFGDVTTLSHSSMFSAVELFFFMGIGILGGAIGALYNQLNKLLSMWRMKNIVSPIQQVTEVVGISIVVSSIIFMVPYFFGTCLSRPDSTTLNYVRFTCPDGEYHDLGTLMFNQSDLSIKQILHSTVDFSYSSLSLFFVTYFFLSCWTYGSSIPSGLFIPNLLAGASIGRMIGQFLKSNLKSLNHINAGTYALVGAAAGLGGMARMTISLTVILIEATGDIQHGLPIMLALILSKLVGDFFNHGLYDIHIHLKKYDFLEWFPPAIADFLLAMDIMHTNVKSFKEVEKVSTVLEMLKNSSHNGFPIVDTNSQEFRGLVLRKHLYMILYHRKFFSFYPEPYNSAPLLNFEDIEGRYPRYRRLDEIELNEDELSHWIDLTPYMNPSPYVMQEHSPVSHVFNIFRTMGLRHLTIVNKSNEVVGMVTRKDLTHIRFQNQLQELLDVNSEVHRQRQSGGFHAVLPSSWGPLDSSKTLALLD